MFYKDCDYNNRQVATMSYYPTKLVSWNYGIM